jgi:acetylornithine deacetylase/succinyl-diaminopimelate desuccinylase-like protein
MLEGVAQVDQGRPHVGAHGTMTPKETPMPRSTPRAFDAEAARVFVQRVWDGDILPTLMEYVRVPAKSPQFDPRWAEHGHLDRAVALAEDWARGRPIEGLRAEVVRLPGRTPLLLMDVPGHGEGTALLYGHLDKQPEMVGWDEGLGPWTPVIRDGRLFGRGAGDDGYAAFAALTAIETLEAQGVPHARCVILIETCEESGSPDLPAYIEHLAGRLGTPDLVICLDSSCADYEHLWSATSLRGLVKGELSVEILGEGVHSGASGIVPSSFRILRQLLARLEDAGTGAILPADFQVTIPPARVAQARAVASVLGDEIWARFPFVEGAGPVSRDRAELLLNQTWRPALAITGAAGLPSLEDAGNVLRPRTAVKISLRVPPTIDATAATRALRQLFESDPPYGARVRFTGETASHGWDAPALAPWLEASCEQASQAFFGTSAMYTGVGGSIPFMHMLGARFPAAQFLITGAMGPGSNAHGPNEFLDLPTSARVTACAAAVLADHYRVGGRVDGR